ncbi:restriction endonuclease [Nocardioides sp. KIGAM211]|uniref:Restriction endonuclease n=1 Tax=Nocardioides luti TaxID=2761101 RepID=A0A7X0VAE4_9ACTN|nr:restriction endonuclease [Nocardioides luti]MBB6627506.1 restriction endonuclease [Nocardioides luti]
MWKAAPAGWSYWRQPQPDEDAIARSQLVTRSDRLFQLNLMERLIRSYAEHLSGIESPKVRAHLAAQPIGAQRKVRKGMERAHQEASQSLNSTRDALLFVLRRDLPADESTIGWIRVAEPRLLNALAWSRHVLGLAPTESAVERRLRIFNSFPYGAVDLTGVDPRDDGNVDVDVVVPEAAWRQAEQLAAYAMRQFGFHDAHVTNSGADGGIDVQARRMVAQVKYMSRPIGRPDVQKLVGAADGLPVAFFSASGFTQQAEDFAAERAIALFRITLPQSVSPLNERALQLVTQGRTASPP